MNLFERITSSDYVHIIDDFYPSLQHIEEHLKHNIFHRRLKDNYAGKTSNPPKDNESTLSRIRALLGPDIDFDYYDGQVRLTLAEDKGREKSKVHIDRDRIIILIYLSDLPPGIDAEEFGTNFHIHKRLKRKRFVHMDPIRDSFQYQEMLKDTINPEAWETWLRVPYRKNRALIYDGNLYHSPTEVFVGEDARSGRLTQHFFPWNLKNIRKAAP